MTDVLQATYSDLKTVKTRSVCQLILEMPIEALTDVVGLLGAPVPGNEVWVAVVRLRQPGAEPASVPDEADTEPDPLPLPKPKSLAQIAGILSNSGAFQKWCGAKNADEAADYIRGHCGVASRAEIDGSENASRIFRELRAEFNFWMEAPEVSREETTRSAA